MMIFEDTTGRRWRIAILVFWIVSVMFGFSLTGVVVGAFMLVPLPDVYLEHLEEVEASLQERESGERENSLVDEQNHSFVTLARAQGDAPVTHWDGEPGEVFRVTRADHTASGGYILKSLGDPFPDKSILLTFDDGPDPVWTPQILELLAQEKIPAVFFVIGKQVSRYPELLEQIVREGHLVGNHTFNHPNLFEASSLRLWTELNAAQRLIQLHTENTTVLFRTPYYIRRQPFEPRVLSVLADASSMGYVYVSAGVDSEDWRPVDGAGIVQTILDQLDSPEKHIIVLHDAGGDRTSTVEALAMLIPELRSRGYRFIGLDEALGLARGDIMAPANPWQIPIAVNMEYVSLVLHSAWLVIRWIFVITAILATLRVVLVGSFSVYSIFPRRTRAGTVYARYPCVSVIIPAFNEEKTIERTVAAVQRSSHTNLEILVVDDGSTDSTAAVVERLMAQDPRIRLICKENGGKWSALNAGLAEVCCPVFVTIDADTLVRPHTIRELLQPFADPAVSAACGNVQVGNVRNLLTGFQALEYITAQNFDRRGFEVLNCISVVPGATSAWRTSVVRAVGGYSNDTLAEDADLTLTLLAQGGRVVHVPDALSCTEAPDTIHALAKQRFRWIFGTYQCLRKHAHLFFRGTLGWVALPNIFLFHLVLPALSPLGDLAIVISLGNGKFFSLFLWYLLFLYMDVLGSILAFSIDQKPKRMMWLIILQRFFYRQFMYVIVYRVLVAILRGQRQRWNKLRRTGTAVLAGQYA